MTASTTNGYGRTHQRGIWGSLWTRLAVSLIALFIAFAGYTHIVYAIGQPNALNILSVNVYENVVDTGDMLVVAHYEIVYNVTPPEFISSTYLFRVRDSAGDEVGRAAPQVYFAPALNLQNGYGQGITSIYLTAAEATGLFNSNMSYRLEGNPGVAFVGGLPTPFVTTDETFNTATPVAGELRNDLLAIANNLTFDWDELTDYTNVLIHSAGGTVLSAAAESYFTTAIPGLAQMAPALFASRIVDIAPTPIATFDNSFRNTLVNRLDGTVIGTGLDNLGAAFGSDGDVARTAVAVLLFLGVFVGTTATNLFGTIRPERIGLLTAWGVMVLGAGVGIPPINALAVVALLLTSVVGFTFFYVRS